MTELGPLPEGWAIVTLGNVVQLIRNGLTKSQNKNAEGIPVTRIETIASETIDATRVGYLKNITQTDIEQYKLRNGDILFSHINSEPQLGKTAIYEGRPPTILHGMNLLLVRTNQEKCWPQYLNALFKMYRARGVFMGLAARAVGQASIRED